MFACFRPFVMSSSIEHHGDSWIYAELHVASESDDRYCGHGDT